MNDETTELRQLWYAASLYQRYAAAIAQQPLDRSVLVRELSNQFKSSMPQDAGLTDLIIHMASAGTRASTAYDIVDKNAGKEYRSILKNDQLTGERKNIQLEKKFDCFIMHMLRDNIGHREHDEFGKHWQLRQDFLGGKTVSEVYQAFQTSMQNLKKLLADREIIEL